MSMCAQLLCSSLTAWSRNLHEAKWRGSKSRARRLLRLFDNVRARAVAIDKGGQSMRSVVARIRAMVELLLFDHVDGVRHGWQTASC